jgi:hypothetical protein
MCVVDSQELLRLAEFPCLLEGVNLLVMRAFPKSTAHDMKEIYTVYQKFLKARSYCTRASATMELRNRTSTPVL